MCVIVDQLTICALYAYTGSCHKKLRMLRYFSEQYSKIYIEHF